jgi:hypothetical protein
MEAGDVAETVSAPRRSRPAIDQQEGRPKSPRQPRLANKARINTARHATPSPKSQVTRYSYAACDKELIYIDLIWSKEDELSSWMELIHEEDGTAQMDY